MICQKIKKPPIGSIIWRDLTVPNADEVKNFYCDVVGWTASAHSSCDDFNIHQGDGEVMAGVCYAKGSNANVPPQWLLYVSVESVEASAAKCVELGGKVFGWSSNDGQELVLCDRGSCGSGDGLD